MHYLVELVLPVKCNHADSALDELRQRLAPASACQNHILEIRRNGIGHGNDIARNYDGFSYFGVRKLKIIHLERTFWVVQLWQLAKPIR